MSPFALFDKSRQVVHPHITSFVQAPNPKAKRHERTAVKSGAVKRFVPQQREPQLGRNGSDSISAPSRATTTLTVLNRIFRSSQMEWCST